VALALVSQLLSHQVLRRYPPRQPPLPPVPDPQTPPPVPPTLPGVDGDQEMLALGLSGAIGAFLGCFGAAGRWLSLGMALDCIDVPPQRLVIIG
jgi:hypothetical protein